MTRDADDRHKDFTQKLDALCRRHGLAPFPEDPKVVLVIEVIDNARDKLRHIHEALVGASMDELA